MELPTKNYSLEADMITGWRPKLKVLGPIPLNFDSKLLDEVIDELTSFGRKYRERVIYLGTISITQAIVSPAVSRCTRIWSTSINSSTRP